MKYQIWVADLNSLYTELNPPTLEETCDNYIQAREAVARLQNHDTAAWIQDNEGNIVA